VLKGPVGMSVRVVELQPRARLSLLVDQAPLRAESHLRASAAVSSVVALAISGYFSWLAVERSPHHQVSFGFLIGFCSLFAAAASLTGYPNGLLGGEDDHGRGVVRTLRSEVAGVDPTDLGGSGWAMWRRAAAAAGVAAAGSLLVLGLMSAALLGRPIGFWLLWAWTAAIAGTAMVLSGSLARRRGVLTAGRRAHGLPTVAGPPVPLLRRAWLIGAVPLGLASALINTGLAWTAYRYGVSTKTLSSDLLGSVIVTSGIGYLLVRQWGRADWSARRLIVPDALLLPDKVRLGAQGLVFGVVAELIVLNLAGHALAHPPAIAAAIAMRSIAGLVAGAMGAGLGEVAGALNAAAETREARP
jgi:hypothetical protein